MLPSFFDSVVSLIVRTSTDLPPDVRAAMKVAMAEESAGTQSAQALSIIAQNIDQAADCEGAICQDTGMPTFEVKTPVGANQIAMKKQIREAVAEATRRGKLRPELRRFDHGRELGQQPRPGHADHPLRAVGARRHRGEADSEGRRLREHERAVPRCRVSCPASAAPTATSRACASASFTRSGTRRAKGARRAPSACASAATARRATSHAKEQLFRTLDDVNPDLAPGGARSLDHGRGQQARHRHDGLRRPHVAHRVQDWRA